jgi:hypothetical protein
MMRTKRRGLYREKWANKLVMVTVDSSSEFEVRDLGLGLGGEFGNGGVTENSR